MIKEEYKHDQADNLVEKRSGNGEVLLSFKIGPGNLKTVRRLASGENHHFEYDRADTWSAQLMIWRYVSPMMTSATACGSCGTGKE